MSFRVPSVWRQDKADRKGVCKLLERLLPEHRLKWIRWCCTMAKQPGGHPVHHVSAGDVTEVFEDWQVLCSQYRVSESLTVEDLEKRVKQHGIPLSFTAGGVVLG